MPRLKIILLSFCFNVFALSVFAQSIDTTLARQYYEDAYALTKKQQFVAADSLLQLSADIYNQAEKWVDKIYCQDLLCSNLMEQGQMEAAQQLAEQTLLESREKLGADHYAEAGSLLNLGSINAQALKIEAALHQFGQARSVREKAFGLQDPKVAEVYREIAEVYSNSAQPQKALELLYQALDINLNAHGENHSMVSAIYSDLARNYGDLAQYTKAIQFEQKAIAILEKIATPGDRGLAKLYNNLAIKYHYTQNLDAALFYLQKSLDILRVVHGEDHYLIGFNYGNQALMLREINRAPESLELMKKAMAIQSNFFGADSPRLAWPYNNIGLVYRDLNQPDSAMIYYEKGEQIFHPHMGNRNYLSGVMLINKGIVLGEKGEYDAAFQYLRKAVNAMIVDEADYSEKPVMKKLVPTISDSEQYLRTLLVQAQLLQARFEEKKNKLDLRAALKTFDLIDLLVDKTRQRLSGFESKANFNRIAVSIIYPEAVDCANRLYEVTNDPKYLEKGFYYVEKGKSNLLAQAMSESSARQYGGVPDSIVTLENNIKEKITAYEGELVQAIAQKDSSKIATLQHVDLFQAQIELDQIIERVEKDYPRYSQVKYQFNPVELKNLQSALDDETLIVEYFINEQSFLDMANIEDPKLYAFTIGKNQLRQTTLNWSDDTVEDITALQKILQKTSIVKAKRKAEFITLSNRLYQQLIEPLQSQLKNKKRLIIIANGVLHYLPFEVLLKNNQNKNFSELDYLLKDFEIAYHYSATLYHKNTQKKQDLKNANLLAFAPVFNTTEDALSDPLASRPWADSTLQSLRGENFQALLWSEKEVQQIGQLFNQKGLDQLVLTHEQASEANLKNKANQAYQFIHIASHSFSNLKEPRFSGIACSPTVNGQEDGILYVGEIYNLSLNADLVVLSSCESGVGQLIKGEGMLGINRGFMYAGTPNIVFSLWKVNDQKSSELMTLFYQNILSGQSYRAALRAAKLSLISQESSALPVYWSPFVLIGK